VRVIAPIIEKWTIPPLQRGFKYGLIQYLTKFNSLIEEPLLISAFIYLKKLVESQKITLYPNNVPLYLMVCLNLAFKFHEEGNEQAFFCKNSGATPQLFNDTEREVLSHLKYNIFITPEEIIDVEKCFAFTTNSAPESVIGQV
jgi:hypothetical protein